MASKKSSSKKGRFAGKTAEAIHAAAVRRGKALWKALTPGQQKARKAALTRGRKWYQSLTPATRGRYLAMSPKQREAFKAASMARSGRAPKRASAKKSPKKASSKKSAKKSAKKSSTARRHAPYAGSALERYNLSRRAARAAAGGAGRFERLAEEMNREAAAAPVVSDDTWEIEAAR